MITPEKTTLSIGFIPLTDSAPLIVAKELGFFQHWGLDVQLKKQNSWATLRDKLHAGILDGAQMLAPMPIASTLGLGTSSHHVIAPLVLSLNGNAITLTEELHQEVLSANGLAELPMPMSAKLLDQVVEDRKQKGADKLTFATVFPYSCHHYQLRDWLNEGGLNENDVAIMIVPPVNMVQAMESGDIDGFCVGGPWNAKAVRGGIGVTVVTSTEIWPDAPEKVLGLMAQFAESKPNTAIALCAALKQACDWLESIPNRFEAATLLSKQRYLGENLEVIAPSLIGSCLTRLHESPRNITSYNQFSNDTLPCINQPLPKHGKWLFEQMQAAGQSAISAENNDKVNSIYREDIYLKALDLIRQRSV